MIEIKIPFKTPTINHLHGHNMRGGFYLKKEAKELKKEIKEIVDGYVIENIIILHGSKLKVTTEVHENWLTKKGTIKKKDIANREKFLIDSVFDALGLEDSFIYEHTMKKIQDTEEFAIVKIDAIEKEETNKCGSVTGS